MRRLVILLSCTVLIAFVPVFTQPAAGAPVGTPAYIVMADLVRGSVKPSGTVCVQTNVFKIGEELVPRVVVLDASTGADPGDLGRNATAIQERGIKVTMYLENGMNFPLRYGRHPGQGDPATWMWAMGWKIPDDFPTGRLRWWLVVTDKTGVFVRWDPIGSDPITIEKR